MLLLGQWWFLLSESVIEIIDAMAVVTVVAVVGVSCSGYYTCGYYG